MANNGSARAIRRRGVRIAEEHLRQRPDDARALYMGANDLVALGERREVSSGLIALLRSARGRQAS